MLAIPRILTRVIAAPAMAALFSAAAPANAIPVQIQFDATLSFDGSAVVAAGGINAADVIDDIFGEGFGAAGTVPLTGSFTYESGTPVFQQEAVGSSSAANYLSVITAAQLGIAGTNTVASIPLINASTSDGSFVTGVGNGGFCTGGFSSCGTVPIVPTTNAASIADNTDVTIFGPGGEVSFATRDSFLAVLGGTLAMPEFEPMLDTGIVGEVFVDALFFSIVGQTDEDLFTSNALPSSASFFDLSRIDNTVVAIRFNGPNLTAPIILTGSASNVAIATPIPEPQTYALMIAGFVALAALAKTRNKG